MNTTEIRARIESVPPTWAKTYEQLRADARALCDELDRLRGYTAPPAQEAGITEAFERLMDLVPSNNYQSIAFQLGQAVHEAKSEEATRINDAALCELAIGPQIQYLLESGCGEATIREMLATAGPLAKPLNCGRCSAVLRNPAEIREMRCHGHWNV